MHGVGYQSASSEIELKEKLCHFFKPSNKPLLLEIFTPKDLNDSYLLEYLNFIIIIFKMNKRELLIEKYIIDLKIFDEVANLKVLQPLPLDVDLLFIIWIHLQSLV